MPDDTRKDPRLEYVSDVAYPRKFVSQIAPATLRLVAAMNGLAVPSEEDFDYCEIGSANGDSLALYAAANPGARFVGIDFNAVHTARASELARRAELSNATFLARDVDGLEREDLPSFDFVVAHGFLSWVSRDKREAAYRFAAARLKPGGLFYVSYNTLPGWAAVEPLRRFMLDRARGATTLDRARSGVEALQRLADSGATFFLQNPSAKSMLALMQSAGLPYVVHEYFHACFEPMYFADVESSLAAHGFSFVGGVPLHLNVRELATPPQVRKVAEETTSRTEFEMLKDFVTNEFFRSDVYVKGKVDRTEAEMRFYFESTPFGTMAQPGQIKRDAKLGSYTLDYKGPVYDALVPALADGPVTAMQLAQRKELVHLGQARIGDCLKNLVLGGQVVPMRALSVSSSKGPWRIRLPYNEAALEDAVFGERPLVLACPATGAGMHLSLLELMALHQLVHSGDDDSGPWLARIATKREFPIAVGERKIKDVHELGRILPRELEKLRSNVPKLIELGILEPAS